MGVVKSYRITIIMAAKKKVGRPPFPKGKARGLIIALRLQPEERAAFDKAAKRRGLSLSDWIRKMLKAAIGHDIV
jgi:predicted HicB family RNase H-like nuclease